MGGMMKIVSAQQDSKRPAGVPPINDPVRVTLDCKVWYDTGAGLKLSTGAIFCERRFAETVLAALEAKCVKYGYGLVHVGIYAPRLARHEDGTPILIEGKPRVSNHNGRAIDWKGFKLPDGTYLTVPNMRKNAPARYIEILDHCRHMMRAIGLRAEVQPESTWTHLAFWPM